MPIEMFGTNSVGYLRKLRRAAGSKGKESVNGRMKSFVSTNFRSDLKKSRGSDAKPIFKPTDFSMRMRFHERLWWNRLLSFPPNLEHGWSPIFLIETFPKRLGIRFDLVPFWTYFLWLQGASVGPPRLFQPQKSLHFGKR